MKPCVRQGCQLTATTTATWHQDHAPVTVDVCDEHAREVEAADVCSVCLECFPARRTRAVRLGLCADHLPVRGARRESRQETAMPPAPQPAPQPSQEPAAGDLEAVILGAISEAGPSSLRSLAARVGISEYKLRPTVRALVDRGALNASGSTTSRRYALPERGEPAAAEEPRPRMQRVAPCPSLPAGGVVMTPGPAKWLDEPAPLAVRPSPPPVPESEPTAAEVELEDLRARVVALEARVASPPAPVEVDLISSLCDDLQIPIGSLPWRLGYLACRVLDLQRQADLARLR